MGFITRSSAATIWMAGLSCICLILAQPDLPAQTYGNLQYSRTNLWASPTNFFRSNIIAGTSITITVGANGELTISSTGGSGSTQFVTAAFGTLTETNGLYLGAPGVTARAYRYNIPAAAYSQWFVSGSGAIQWGTNNDQHVFAGTLVGPDLDSTTVLGQFNRRWLNAWIADYLNVSNAFFSGFVSVTNVPGNQLGYVELRSTNGTAYTRFSRVSDAWKPTNYFKFSITNPVASQLLGFNSVSYSAGEASIVVTNITDDWLLYPTNVWNSRQGGSANLTNWSLYDTNVWNSRQEGSANLTNWSGVVTGAFVRTLNGLATNLAVNAGGGTSNAFVGGIMWTDTARYTNCCPGAVLTNMNQFTVPGNTLTNDGDAIRWWIAGRMVSAIASTNEIAVLFGASTVLDTGLQIASNRQWTATGTITRTGVSSQRIESTFWWPGAGTAWTFTNMVTDIAETCGANTILKVQGASRRVSTLTNMLLKVAYEPAYR
jgi:hypothetical protein